MRPFRSLNAAGLRIIILAAGVALPSCSSDGNFTLFGYTTAPNYECGIKTVRVPIFKNEWPASTVRPTWPAGSVTFNFGNVHSLARRLV